MATLAVSGAADLPRELPLVGRRAELEHLFRLFGRDGAGEPVALVQGEPGVGKSRVARAVAAEARRRGWTVVEGRAYPVESGMPYGLLADAFLPVLRGLDAGALSVLTRGTSGDLRRLFPALGAPDPAMDWDPEESRTRVFWAFSEFLGRLGERGPLLLVAEDLHWADPSSLALLHFVARQIQGEPIRILGTASEGYPGDLEALGKLERSLASQGILSRLDLAPLGREDVDELLFALFGVGGGPLREFAERLFDWTHGNPHFLEETLHALVEGGRLFRRDGTWLGWEVEDLELPGSVRDALLLRLGSLSPAARTLADLAAVSGGRAPARLLGLVGDLDSEALTGAAEELTRRALADEREEGREVVVELRHPMVRETLYRNLGPSRRRLLHRRLGEGLEALYPGAEAPVDRLAYHFTRGGTAVEDGRAVRYLAEAGRSALARHADGEAVAYLTAAVERYPADLEAPGVPARGSLQADLARGLSRLGRYGDASATWTDLLTAAGRSGQSEGAAEALRHLGLLAYWRGRHLEALDLLDQALSALSGLDAPAQEARIQLAAGVALQELGRAEEARGRIGACLELARALDDPMLLGRAHRALALLYTWIGQAEEARRHGWQAVELGDRAGDPYVRFWGRWALASLAGLTGDTEEMRRLMAQAGQVADELHSPVLKLWTAELEVEYAYAAGDWDGALAQGERAIRLADALSQTTLLPRLLVWTALVYLGRGDLERARSMVDRAWALAGLEEGGPGVGDVHVVVPAHIGAAACLLAQGRWDEAVAIGEAGVELADRAGYVFWSLHLLLPIVGEALIRRRNLAAAVEVGGRMRRDGERMGHRLASAWADACDALVLWVSGDTAGGLELLEGAAAALESIPMRYDAARVRRQIAGRLADLGRREEALAELRRVHEVFGELGAQPELEKCREMFREMEARPPSRAQAEGVADLTGREWEIAQLVARRLSNKAIAKELGVAQRTITTHLGNIYRKLGIASRGELADRVREGRLTAVETR